MKRKIAEEAAAANAAEELEEEEVHPPKKIKLGSIYTNLVDAKDKVVEIYDTWIKPIHDNWEQIKRRSNAVATVISLIFFIIYVPVILFDKLSDGVNLDWEIALYVCIGIYAVMVIALLITTLACRSFTTTEAAKKIKIVRKIIQLVVRIASVAVGITAVVLTGYGSGPLNTIAMVVAIISIIFSIIPLFFGGIAGFVKWLISPAKIKLKFSFVALEWYQKNISDKLEDKKLKKAFQKHGDKVGDCLDNYFLPAFGNKYINNVDSAMLSKSLEGVAEKDKNLSEWVLKSIFAYALDCKYINYNPVSELDLGGDIVYEDKPKKPEKETKPSIFSRIASAFNRNTTNTTTDDSEEE